MGHTVNKLNRPQLVGPMSTLTAGPRVRDAWAGQTQLGSGQASVTISTTVITSGAMILFGSQVSSVGLGANSGGGIVANSIVDGRSFCIARPTGIAAPFNEFVSWLIIERNPF